LELTARATNLTLLGLNMRDGLRMTGKLGSGRGSSFEVALVGRDTVADGTMAFHFTRPGGFTYEAGQHVTLKLINPAETDAAGNSRAFTLASAPHEAELTVATRMRDTAFKRTLKGLPIGGKISLTGPRGDMTLHADPARPAVFLAGGIGITPFLSMARHAAHAKLPHKIVLIYSNRRPEDAAFLAELQQLAKTNQNFKLVATMTTVREAAQAWDGETSVINEELLRRSLPDVLSPIYYFAGPGPMVGQCRTCFARSALHSRTCASSSSTATDCQALPRNAISQRNARFAIELNGRNRGTEGALIRPRRRHDRDARTFFDSRLEQARNRADASGSFLVEDRRDADLCAAAKHRNGGAPDHFDKPIVQAGALLSGRPICGAFADQPAIRGCLPRQPIHLNSVCSDARIDRGRLCSRRGCCKSGTISAPAFLRSMLSSNTYREPRCCETKALGARFLQCNSGSAHAELLPDLNTPSARSPAQNRQPMSRLVRRPYPSERLMAS